MVLPQTETIIIIIIWTYIALISTNLWCSRRITLLPLLIRCINHSWNISAPWGVNSWIAAISAHIGLIKHNNQLCPHRYPFPPGWREAIMVKCLAQGHKHHGRSRDLNPHSDDSAIRTQIRCTKPPGHGTPLTQLKVKSQLLVKMTSIGNYLL